MIKIDGIPQFMGVRIKRREDPALITGAAKYTADFKADNLLYLGIVRSPYAQARILDIDSSAAAEVAGIAAIYTAADLKDTFQAPLPKGTETPAHIEQKVPTRYPLATDMVHHVGEPVAAVLANNRYALADAMELIFVDYEPLDAIADPEEALQDGSPLVHEEFGTNLAFTWVNDQGEVDDAFSNAAHTLEIRVENQRVIANAMEPRAAFATYDAANDQATVWTTTQSPHGALGTICGILGLTPEQLRVIAPEVGGGFGVKANVYHEEILTVYASRALNRPVKWIATRSEDYLSTAQGRGQVQTVRLAADAEGKITAVDLGIIFDVGAYYTNIAPIIPTLTGLMMTGVYTIPNIRVNAKGVFTNKLAAEPYRGAGRPEAIFMIERAMSAMAAKMGIDAADLRRRNFIPPDQFPYTTVTGAVYDSGEYDRALTKLLETAGYDDLRAEQENRRQNGGKLLGIGLSAYVEVCGFGPFEMGSVTMDGEGKVTVLTGTSPHGQGHHTAWSQIAADILQIPMEDVTVIHGDTAVVPRGVGTFGSRSAAVGGSSVFNNAHTVRDNGKAVAAQLLEAAVEDIELVDGQFQVVGVPDRTVSWNDIAEAVHSGSVPEELNDALHAEVDFKPEGNLYPFGTHLCLVEVDPDTGVVEVIKYVTVDDCGNVINPMIVEGQLHGGIAQGLGQALLEHAQYDDMGTLVSGTLLDYAMPRIDHFPHLDINRTETPTPINPMGVKGVGEAGTIGATPAVANAVIDALTHLGIHHLNMPLTAQKIWTAIREN